MGIILLFGSNAALKIKKTGIIANKALKREKKLLNFLISLEINFLFHLKTEKQKRKYVNAFFLEANNYPDRVFFL